MPSMQNVISGETPVYLGRHSPISIYPTAPKKGERIMHSGKEWVVTSLPYKQTEKGEELFKTDREFWANTGTYATKVHQFSPGYYVLLVSWTGRELDIDDVVKYTGGTSKRDIMLEVRRRQDNPNPSHPTRSLTQKIYSDIIAEAAAPARKQRVSDYLAPSEHPLAVESLPSAGSAATPFQRVSPREIAERRAQLGVEFLITSDPYSEEKKKKSGLVFDEKTGEVREMDEPDNDKDEDQPHGGY